MTLVTSAYTRSELATIILLLPDIPSAKYDALVYYYGLMEHLNLRGKLVVAAG